MTVETETLKPLHDLTDEGKEQYDKLLTFEANKILLQVKYPMINFLYKVSTALKLTFLTNLIERKYL